MDGGIIAGSVCLAAYLAILGPPLRPTFHSVFRDAKGSALRSHSVLHICWCLSVLCDASSVASTAPSQGLHGIHGSELTRMTMKPCLALHPVLDLKDH